MQAAGSQTDMAPAPEGNRQETPAATRVTAATKTGPKPPYQTRGGWQVSEPWPGSPQRQTEVRIRCEESLREVQRMQAGRRGVSGGSAGP